MQRLLLLLWFIAAPALAQDGDRTIAVVIEETAEVTGGRAPVGGIVKAHAAGLAVSLFRPALAGL